MPVRVQQTPTKSYRILVVLEPSRAWTAKDARKNELHAEWIREDLPDEEAEALLEDEGTKGFIYLDTKHPAEAPNHTAVISHEKVRNVYVVPTHSLVMLHSSG